MVVGTRARWSQGVGAREGRARASSDGAVRGGVRWMAAKARPQRWAATQAQARRREVRASGAGNGGGGGKMPPPAITAADVLGQGRGRAGAPTSRFVGRERGAPRSDETAVFFLLALNLVGYVLDHVLHLGFMKGLYLHHMQPQWWQFLTSLFCHGSWAHLSSNIFFLYIFGKLVEEEEGWGGLIASYLICGAGASAASYLLLSKQSVSLGASGAVFGLFVVSVLCKLAAFNWRRAIEVLILGQFVVEKVMTELSVSVAGGKMAQGMVVNHVAHLAGAAVGAMLIYLVALIPERGGGDGEVGPYY